MTQTCSVLGSFYIHLSPRSQHTHTDRPYEPPDNSQLSSDIIAWAEYVVQRHTVPIPSYPTKHLGAFRRGDATPI